jgi:hypothetical protein
MGLINNSLLHPSKYFSHKLMFILLNFLDDFYRFLKVRQYKQSKVIGLDEKHHFGDGFSLLRALLPFLDSQPALKSLDQAISFFEFGDFLMVDSQTAKKISLSMDDVIVNNRVDFIIDFFDF